MTKQEEIREEIATVIRVNQDKFARCVNNELLELLIYWMTDKIRHNLHSQGVVITSDNQDWTDNRNLHRRRIVEPLIKEG